MVHQRPTFVKTAAQHDEDEQRGRRRHRSCDVSTFGGAKCCGRCDVDCLARAAERRDLQQQRADDRVPGDQHADDDARAGERCEADRDDMSITVIATEYSMKSTMVAAARVRQAAGEHERAADRETRTPTASIGRNTSRAPGDAHDEQRRALAARDDEVAEHAVADVLRSGGRADQDRRDVAEPDDEEHVVLEVRRAARRTVVGGVHRMQGDDDDLRDQHGPTVRSSSRSSGRGDGRASALRRG